MSSPARIVGIDIGGTKCALAHLDAQGTVREDFRFATRGPDETLEMLAAVLERLALPESPVIGISAGTLLDRQGLISTGPNLIGWNDVPIVEFFRRRFGGRVHLMNDANACALAEWWHGAGRGCRHMAFLTAGTGMGAGLILDGQLYTGIQNAGEAGHMRLAPDGPVGYGKRGSFEGFCSGGGIGRWAQERLRARGATAGFGAARVADVTAATVGAAAAQGDPEALELLAQAGARLGQALAILIDLLHLERIVIGGVYGRCRQWLDPAMLEALGREALPGPLADCQILPSILGEEVGNYGAVAVAQYWAMRSDDSR